jgi:hypothetical protein
MFDASAEHLPQAEIRAAIQEELGRPLATANDVVSERFSVRVNSARGLVLEFRSRGSVIERHVPLPSRPEDVPLVVALLAGNLVRDQRSTLPRPAAGRETEVLAEEKKPPPDPPPRVEPPPRRAPALAPKPSPPREPPRHWVGLHLAQDLAFIGGANVCDPTLGQATESYACFLEDTDDRPFVHTPYPLLDAVEDDVVLASTRVLFSYDYSPAPIVSVGARIGYALGGGPPAGQTAAADGTGSGGTPFFPFHLEARLTFWILPPSAPISLYLGASAGAAQVDARATVREKDCNADAQLGLPSASAEDAFEACRTAASNFNFAALPDVKVDAWKKVGQAFYGAHVGAGLQLTEQLRGVANVNVLSFAPASGVVLEPSLGVTMGI